MHDMPQYSKYDASEHRAYLEFNSCFATVSYLSAENNRDWFVNDYQLALAPRLLKNAGAEKTVVFWHIPWPKNVPDDAVPFISEIAEGLLSARVLAFHTEEYVDNFKRFVRRHLPEHFVPAAGNEIFGVRGKWRVALATERATTLISQPLGIDQDLWSNRVRGEDDESEAFIHQLTGGKRFVLSVDRADYTKGVLPRLDAIDRFLEENQHLLNEVVFVQICQQSRAGISQFDNYWQAVMKRYQSINERWGEGDWKPLVWVSTSVTPNTLAKLYRSADVMLINAVRDGLNLTAKEFVACQTNKPGALILSNETGVYHELRDHVLAISPQRLSDLTAALDRALKMSLKERLFRVNSMRRILSNNTLTDWWLKMTSDPESHASSLAYIRDGGRQAV